MSAPEIIMGADEASAMLDAIRHHLEASLDLLEEFDARGGWKALGYGSLVECLQEQLDVRRSRAYQLIDAGRVRAALAAAAGERIDLTERAAREIKDSVDEVAADVADRVEHGQEAQRAVQGAVDVNRAKARERREYDATAAARAAIDEARSHISPLIRRLAQRWHDTADPLTGQKILLAARWLHARAVDDDIPAEARAAANAELETLGGDPMMTPTLAQAAVARVRTIIDGDGQSAPSAGDAAPSNPGSALLGEPGPPAEPSKQRPAGESASEPDALRVADEGGGGGLPLPSPPPISQRVTNPALPATAPPRPKVTSYGGAGNPAAGSKVKPRKRVNPQAALQATLAWANAMPALPAEVRPIDLFGTALEGHPDEAARVIAAVQPLAEALDELLVAARQVAGT